jgi:outer membrane immunogenic protein
MKRFVLGSVALAAMVAGPAMAADMPLKAPAPAVSYYDWTGVYLGASIGWARPEVTREYPLSIPAVSSTSNSNETIYDVHAGAQVQWGWLILGAEAGYSAGFREMQSTALLPNPPFGGCGVGCVAFNKVTNIFTAGPRIGIAWDRWMFFGTGGYAAASISGGYNCLSNGLMTFGGPGSSLCAPGGGVGQFSGKTWNDGWFAGAGLEYMIYKGVLVDAILGAEYQHVDVSSKTAFADLVGIGANTFTQKAKVDIARARLTIKTHAWDFLR